MSAVNRSEDPEPSQPVPAGLLHIPVRSGRAGCTVRFFRTLPGGRTAAGFTSAAKLTAALGVNQESIRLSDPALRALAGPLGVFTLIVDPRFSARPEVLVGPAAPSLPTSRPPMRPRGPARTGTFGAARRCRSCRSSTPRGRQAPSPPSPT